MYGSICLNRMGDLNPRTKRESGCTADGAEDESRPDDSCGISRFDLIERSIGG